eukprot:TRINITY_DN49237_c0_g1_i1.p1 TRINITY_DN49237_c0_g1~~TRINITY_DN49237_c0_g1_i1.p1  ORF type:complete len:177 (+),score=32.69 TRINITY_DN49237_c0_g1_i1:84-614(+)
MSQQLPRNNSLSQFQSAPQIQLPTAPDDFDNILFFESRQINSHTPDFQQLFAQPEEKQQNQANNEDLNSENQIQCEFDFGYFGEELTEEHEEENETKNECINQNSSKEMKAADPIFKVQYIAKKIQKIDKKKELKINKRNEALQRFKEKKKRRKYSYLTEELHQGNTIDFVGFSTF